MKTAQGHNVSKRQSQLHTQDTQGHALAPSHAAKPNRTHSGVHAVHLPYILLLTQSNMKRHTMFPEVKVGTISVIISMRRNVDTKPKTASLCETSLVCETSLWNLKCLLYRSPPAHVLHKHEGGQLCFSKTERNGCVVTQGPEGRLCMKQYFK